MANQGQQQHPLTLIEDEKVVAGPFHFHAGGNEIKSEEYNKNRSAEFDRNRRRRKVVMRSSCTGSSSRREKMANHPLHQQHEKEKMFHFSHRHLLTLIEDEKVEMSKSDEYSKKNRSLLLRCYGCTEKIRPGVAYYRCEEHCPSFCLHHSCAHLPTTVRRWHSAKGCNDRDLQLMKRPNKDKEYCTHCWKDWYRFTYVCSDCRVGIDVRCAMKGPNEAKHSFHQHPVEPFYSRGRKVYYDDEDDDDDDDSQLPVCAVCSLIITPLIIRGGASTMYYRCNYCNFNVHPECTNVPPIFESPSHPQHALILSFNYTVSKICKICQEEIDCNTQWAYVCNECYKHDDVRYYIHAGYEGCLTSTIRKGDLQHFDHEHPLALVEEEAPPTLRSIDDHSITQGCRCCGQKISLSVPYYTCIHCNKYQLHKLCALLPTEIKHPLHPNCTLKLLSGLDVFCHECDQVINGFAYHCSPCKFDLNIECALKTQKVKKIFHKHPLFLSLTKGPFRCYACDRDNEGSAYKCSSCIFWVHEQCASLPAVKDKSSHEHPHELHLVHNIPEKYSGVVVYCRICTEALKHQRWAYHCKLCRYFIHIHNCSSPNREGDVVAIDASDVVELPLDGEPILEEKLVNGKITKHHRHPMILFADQLESSAIDVTNCFMNLIRGSAKWPTFRVNGKDYSGITFSFHKNTLTMQVTGVELPHYIKHEDHPHVLESTFVNSSTWCHACEQSFFGRGFKCTTCAFTIDAYCALLPRMIKHRYDKHGFSLTYSAIEGVEEYVCEICEEDVTPRYFYHCEACDQSIHSRCIWKAYVQFAPNYKFDLDRRSVILVPPSEELPECIICEQKEAYGHGFAFQDIKDVKYMVHLTCISEDDVETWQLSSRTMGLIH